MSTVIKNTRLTLEMIKIEHTLFALPFAFLGAVLAANGLPTLRQVFWIIVAMVGARSAAMAFNSSWKAGSSEKLVRWPCSVVEYLRITPVLVHRFR